MQKQQSRFDMPRNRTPPPTSPLSDFWTSGTKPSFLRSSLKNQQPLSLARTDVSPFQKNNVHTQMKKEQYFQSQGFENQGQNRNGWQEDKHNKNRQLFTVNYGTSGNSNHKKQIMSPSTPREGKTPWSPKNIKNEEDLQYFQANEYKKLHEKLNFLQKKITHMRAHLEKKRQQKHSYFQNHQKTLPKTPSTSSPLSELVQQVPNPKSLKPLPFNPYSPRTSQYYIGQIVRAYKNKDSLIREHLQNSMQFLKMFQYAEKPTVEQLGHRVVSLPKAPRYQGKKTIVFDLDQTLIHCNENASMPCDAKLPIHFPTGQLIFAGINVRPYARELLENLSEKFQIIIFTASHQCYADVVIDFIDPKRCVSHRLFREHCYLSPKGMYVKDLRILATRNLKQILLVDNASYSFAHQPDNGVPIIPYYQGKVDFQLKALQAYLEGVQEWGDVGRGNGAVFGLCRYPEFNTVQELVETLYKGKEDNLGNKM